MRKPKLEIGWSGDREIGWSEESGSFAVQLRTGWESGHRRQHE